MARVRRHPERSATGWSLRARLVAVVRLCARSHGVAPILASRGVRTFLLARRRRRYRLSVARKVVADTWRTNIRWPFVAFSVCVVVVHVMASPVEIQPLLGLPLPSVRFGGHFAPACLWLSLRPPSCYTSGVASAACSRLDAMSMLALSQFLAARSTSVRSDCFLQIPQLFPSHAFLVLVCMGWPPKVEFGFIVV